LHFADGALYFAEVLLLRSRSTVSEGSALSANPSTVGAVIAPLALQ
jgi:hypothetical protein